MEVKVRPVMQELESRIGMIKFCDEGGDEEQEISLVWS
jgi:hypothetical protein